MRIFKNKRSSLELSIRTIVVVVLAMTLLGLGLGFIRTIFGGISETAFTVQDQIKQQILEDLRSGNKKLSFPTNEVQIPHGQDKVLAVGIKNTNPAELKFKIQLKDVTSSPIVTIKSGGTQSKAGKFIWDEGEQILTVNEANVYPVKLTAGTDTGTYIIKIIAYDTGGSAEYATKSFFVTVT